jgi:hypothetical protein
VAKGVWDKISPADQQIVQKAAFAWRDKQRKMVQESSDDFLAKLKAKGMQVNAPNNALFVKAVAPVWKQYEDVFGKEFFDLIVKVAGRGKSHFMKFPVFMAVQSGYGYELLAAITRKPPINTAAWVRVGSY